MHFRTSIPHNTRNRDTWEDSLRPYGMTATPAVRRDRCNWSFGIQREISPNLAVEASYIANRGVWWNSPGLIDVNALTPQRLASFGLDITNSADQNSIKGTLADAGSRGFHGPYVGYPTNVSLAQSLRPFPQFTSITSLWSPLGNTWYDSLQVKGTKRFSHGLSFTSNFTWSK